MSEKYKPLDPNNPEFVLDLKNTANDAVSIVIIHKDKPEYLNLCLQSIVVCSSNNNYEIIVVDNSSGSETQTFLNEIQNDIKIVRNNKNLYWSGGANSGFKQTNSKTKYVIFMHSDVVIINPSWIDLLINVCEANNAGMVGIETSNCLINNQRIDFIQEWCVLFTRECLERIGPWPEELPMIGHTFIMTLKSQIKGFKPQIMKNNIAHHYKVFGVDINDWEKMQEESSVMLPKVYQNAQSRTL